MGQCMKISHNLLIIIVFLLTSCIQKHEVRIVKIGSIELSDSLDIISNEPFGYIQSKGDTLFIQSDKNILLYSTKTGHIKSLITLDSIHINSFLYQNEDSLFILSQSKPTTLYIFNTKQKVTKSLKIDSLNSFADKCTFANFKESPLYFQNNIIYLNSYISWIGENASFDSIRFKQIAPLWSFNLKTKELNNLSNLPYPYPYLSVHHSPYSRVFKTYSRFDDKIFFASPFIDSIYILNGSKLEAEKIGIDDLSYVQPFDLKKFHTSSDYLSSYFYSNPYLYQIHPVSKNIVLIILLESSNKENADGTYLTNEDKKWSIVAYNTKTKKSQKLNLDFDNYFYYDTFLNGETIFLRTKKQNNKYDQFEIQYSY